jgi:hypothetical protein
MAERRTEMDRRAEQSESVNVSETSLVSGDAAFWQAAQAEYERLKAEEKATCMALRESQMEEFRQAYPGLRVTPVADEMMLAWTIRFHAHQITVRRDATGWVLSSGAETTHVGTDTGHAELYGACLMLTEKHN